MKVLSVDDRQENLYFLESLLRSQGHEVASVSNGLQAIETLERDAGSESPFDLVITDILMPGMDGFRLCREIKSRERLRTLPIIVYTATYTSAQDRDFALSLGAARFIVKPVEPDVFIDALNGVMAESDDFRKPDPAAAEGELASSEYLRVYNERLVRKLERKLQQLEESSQRLTELVAQRDAEIERRREVERQLIRSQEHLQLIWNGSSDGLVLTDAAGAILKANPALAAISGVDLPCGGPMSVAAPAWLGGLSPAEGAVAVERRLAHPDGSEKLVELTSMPIAASDGEVIFHRVHDVTDLRRKEAERAMLEAELAEARKMESVGRLAGGIAHDFNNLLTVINGYCDLALRRAPESAPPRESLERIRVAGSQAAELTSQLLAFSRRSQPIGRRMNLNSVIEETVPMLRRLIGDDIRVVTQLAPDLGAIRVRMNELIQILMNLAANARDAMPHGGVLTIATANVDAPPVEPPGPGRIALFYREIGPSVMLTLRDTGTGIPEGVLPRIFEPFFTTKDESGTGLGLFTVAGIVKRNEGSIVIRTSPALEQVGGAEFQICFPRLAPEPGNEISEPEDDRTDDPAFQGGMVLVVDDRPDVRSLVVAALELDGCRVLEAADGEEALRVASEFEGPIDLLLTDLRMPNMDGRELSSRLKAARPAIRVLYMSANPDAAGAAETPGPDYILKPFGKGSLIRAVRAAMRGPASGDA